MWAVRLHAVFLRGNSLLPRMPFDYRLTSEAGFAASKGGIFVGTFFVLLLGLASISDIRTRRIPNRLVGLIAILGMIQSVLTLPLAEGLLRALSCLALGFALWIPFYATGLLGAGDVKLFAAASAWLSPGQVLAAALVSAIVGGVLSVGGLIMVDGVAVTALRLAHLVRHPAILLSAQSARRHKPTLPYGLAMSIGLALVGWFPQLFQSA